MDMMKCLIGIIIALLSTLVFIGCSATDSENLPSSGLAEAESVFDIPAIYAAFEAYGREFPDALNMAANPGLVTEADVTGPFFILPDTQGSMIVPDADYDSATRAAELPDDYSLISDPDTYLTFYRDILETSEKLAAVANSGQETVFVAMEVVGYDLIG
jgi:hypothetical protein